jgi:hypothetical protein
MLWNKPFLDDGLEISPPWGDISIANLRALTCTRAAKSNHFVDIKWQLRRLFQFTLQCQTLWCRKTYGQIKLPVFLVFLLVIAKGTGSPSRFPYGPTTCGASLAQHVVSICSMVLEYLPTFALVQNHPVNCRFLYTSAMVRIWDVVPCVKKQYLWSGPKFDPLHLGWYATIASSYSENRTEPWHLFEPIGTGRTVKKETQSCGLFKVNVSFG